MKLSILTTTIFMSGTLEKLNGCNVGIAIFTTTAAIAAFYYFKK